MVWGLLALSLLVILAGAELFTNGIEWIGEGFGLSEGAVGSVLAAVGTALPETLLPLIAILSGKDSGEEIGTGAILGAPFMLTTLAMVVIAVTVLITSRGGRRSTDLSFDVPVLRQDLGYFLVMYSLAVVAGLLDSKPVDYLLVIVLLVGYVYYVRRHFQTPSSGESDGVRHQAALRLAGHAHVQAVPPRLGQERVRPGAVRPGGDRARADHRGRRAVHPRRRRCRAIRSTSPRSRSRCWWHRSRRSSRRSSTASCGCAGGRTRSRSAT